VHTKMTRRDTQSSVRWISELRVDGHVTFRAGKRGMHLIADWPGLGRLTCARDGSDARFVAASGVPRCTIDKLRGAQVRGLLCEREGGLALHASAVAIDGRAVLFVGADGAGKSTAAAEMCILHGARMLADDVALLEVGEGGAYVLPGEDEHWLTLQSRRALGVACATTDPGPDKRGIRAERAGDSPSPLGLVIALRFEPTASSTVARIVRGSEGARMLMGAALRFDVEDATARRRELEQVTALYRCAPCFELIRPLSEPSGVATFVVDALLDGSAP
jgi:hypothetical protein